MKLSMRILGSVLIPMLTGPILISVPHAFAADMAATLIPDLDKSNATFVGVKNLTLRYPEGSSVAQQLNGKTDRLDFTINATASDPRVASLVQETNKAFAAAKSPVQVNATLVHYQAKISGGPSSASISVKIEYHPTIQKFVLLKEDAQTGGNIVDLRWRSFKVDGPVIMKTPEDGSVNINQAIGLLEAKYPNIASKLSNSAARAVLTEAVMDFTQFNRPMATWHFLFDPTETYGSENGEAKGLSIYSLGESSFREGTFEIQETTASATIDGQTIDVESQTPPPSGQITITGFSNLQGAAGQEFAIVTNKAPEGVTTTPGDSDNNMMGLLSAIDGNSYFVLIRSSTVTPLHYTIDPHNLVKFDIAKGQQGELQLTLPKSMIDQIHTVRVGNGEEIPFQQVLLSSTSTTIKFTVPNGAESIEVLGTNVVPEFPISILAMTAALALITIIALRNQVAFIHSKCR